MASVLLLTAGTAETDDVVLRMEIPTASRRAADAKRFRGAEREDSARLARGRTVRLGWIP
jgi:hypothetical protein